MAARIGIIDLGTNTFHILIAEVEGDQYSFIYKEKIHVSLGKGGINHGRITDEALERAANAMSHIKHILEKFHVRETRCVATSALRNAENSDLVINKLEAVSGLNIDVISGDKEAEYIFEGIGFGLDLGLENALIMDIGGGSVEFIIGSELGILWKESFEIGGQRLVDEFQKNDPITQLEINAINKFLDSSLSGLKDAIGKFNPKTLIGSSGTFDTLSEIYRRRNNIQIIHRLAEFPLTLEAIQSLHQEIISKARKARMEIPGMVEMRVDLIVVASILIQSVLRMNSFENVRVSTYSLKEGIFSQYLKSQKFLV